MGNQKQKWRSAEEEALRAGVAKYGTGKWKNILNDPEFAQTLANRSNIDLKDKWRNLSISTGAQGSKEKNRIPRLIMMTPGALPNAKTSASAVSLAEDNVSDDPSKSTSTPDRKTAPGYNGLIFEALSTIKDPSGSDLGAIVSFIELRHEVPQNFRRLLGSKLRRLVLQGKLEKVQNCYKIKDDTLRTKTLTLKQEDSRPKPSQSTGLIAVSGETVEDAAMAAAYRIAEAENKSFVAAEAVKEAERVSKMAEDAESMLQLLKDIYEQCLRGEIVILA